MQPETKRSILAEARSRWPFVRLPRDDSVYPQHVQFAPPELTEYLFEDEADYERAVNQSGEVEEGLPDLSRAFPDTSFVLIEAECFGGTCLYRGFACMDGRITLVHEAEVSGHLPLLEQVGIKLHNEYFEPFEREYFIPEP